MRFNNARQSILLIFVFCVTVFSQTRIRSNIHHKIANPLPAPEPRLAQDGLLAIKQLNSGDVATGSIPAPAIANDCLFDQTQYRIEIAEVARKLFIQLKGTENPSRNLNLYVRRGAPVAIEGGKILADFKAEFRGSTKQISLPGFGSSGPLQPGALFIAVSNCGPGAAEFTLSATISGPPDADRIGLTNQFETGSVPAWDGGPVRIGRTQYFVSESFNDCGNGLFPFVEIRADQDIIVYVRKDKPVTVENGIVIYDRKSESPAKVHNLRNFLEAPGSAKFFIAIENFSLFEASYTIIAGIEIADIFPPIIKQVFFKKKDLLITGFLFGKSKLFIDGQPQTAISGGFDPVLEEILIVEKAKKKIAHGQTIIIKLDRGDGCVSPPFAFTRP